MRNNKKAEKTRTKIMDTFVALCLRRPEPIPNVSEVCVEMDIYRGTFYNYFSGIQELVEVMSNEESQNHDLLYESLVQMKWESESDIQLAKAPFRKMLENVSNHRDRMVVLMCPDYDFPYRKTNLKMVYQVIYTMLKAFPEQQRHYVAVYSSEGIVRGVYEWLCKQDMTLDEFTEFFFNLTIESLQQLHKIAN